MIRALWTSATGMQAQQTNIDVIANNLANVNTTAFKQSRASFQDLLYANIRPAGSETSTAGTSVPVGIQLGHGVKVASVGKEFTQGSAVHTSNDNFNVDMMIQGSGFFQIELPNGTTAYTRDGKFSVNDEGNIVTQDGYPLISGNPAIARPSDLSISISDTGVMSVEVSGNTVPDNRGQIQLAEFVNPAGLRSIGQNLFLETEASGAPTVNNPGTESMGTINHHFLEQSNVNMVTEMVDMIATQRAYEIGTKAIQTADTMLGQVAGLKR